MNTKELRDKVVVHNYFGKGVIRWVDDSYIEVEFKGANKRCKFQFPGSFYKYLRFENEDLQKDMDSIIEIWKEESGEIKKEELREKYEKTLKMIEVSKNNAEEKKRKAAERALQHRSTMESISKNK